MSSALSLNSVGRICSLWLSFWLTCCIAWPTQYRRAYQYFPPLMTEMGPPNQWDVAAEPVAYEQPEDYYDNTQWADVEALSNLIDMYDNTPSVWGQIVREKPEEELQELKRSQPSPIKQKKQRPSISIGRVVTTPSPSSLSSSSPSSASSVIPPSVTTKVQQQQVNRFSEQNSLPADSFRVGGGQKEVALLRPPNKSRVHSPQSSSSSSSSSAGAAAAGIDDTGIIAASERQKKPSAYDTLRKYLTLEDALKKEQEKRRAGRPQQKRSNNHNFVADEDSLTGQLSNLNKSMA